MKNKTHFESGNLCLDETCKCGGTIQSSGWTINKVLGGTIMCSTWHCKKCGIERKDLRQIKRSW